jgi:S-DNA-T family DNA segregation ATPase FtsK/SpoIIIE
LDGHETAVDLGEALQKTVAGIDAAWSGRRAPRVRELPALIRVTELAGVTAAADAPGVMLGIAEHDLAPVRLDLAGGDQHLLVIGDTGAGKSGFLRTWMRGLAEQHSAREARFMLVDYRRSLGECVPAGYIGACATNPAQAADYAGRLAGTLAERLPTTQLTARQLRDRSWWDGPDLYLVVDDYDMVADGRNSPLQPLLEYAAQGREIGFHVVVARRSGGMSRAAMTDPLITRVRELGAAALLLSSDPREGVLVGNRRGAAMPPGRGVLMRRQEGDMLVQIAVSDDEGHQAED